ncbi:signal peptidase I [Dongia mobilis]|uniref:Signal peptidase I n=1 Tax=Dongia mobilis TaxID=578943 RepID=A0A4R6WTT2_9PROT|nr:signal peptidase I [Dongia mobilis]TDQ82534.1 signal peptidase I [Dongia mobilis]
MARKTETEPSQIAETVKTIVWAALIAVGIRTFAYEPFSIPSSSMVPTLLIGDYLFVSKTAFGYSRYSFPWGLVPFEGRIWSDLPERGEVVVFRPPGEPQTDFIKRVIGLPGDRIQVREGLLYINGAPVKRERIEDFVSDEGVYGGKAAQYIETLPDGTSHRIIERSGDNGQYDNTPTYVVPEGHYFMMGDNRDASNDSRAFRVGLGTDDEITDQRDLGTVGFVPLENLIGPAKILFWSYDDNFELTNPLTWVTALRWRRLGNLVE